MVKVVLGLISLTVSLKYKCWVFQNKSFWKTAIVFCSILKSNDRIKYIYNAYTQYIAHKTSKLFWISWYFHRQVTPLSIVFLHTKIYSKTHFTAFRFRFVHVVDFSIGYQRFVSWLNLIWNTLYDFHQTEFVWCKSFIAIF